MRRGGRSLGGLFTILMVRNRSRIIVISRNFGLSSAEQVGPCSARSIREDLSVWNILRSECGGIIPWTDLSVAEELRQ